MARKKPDPVLTESGEVLGRGKVGRRWAGGAPVSTRQQYGLLGYSSVKGPGPEQAAFDFSDTPGAAEQRYHPVRLWEHMTVGEREHTVNRLKPYGVTPASIGRNIGSLIDRGFDKAAEEQRSGRIAGPDVEPEGQRFYHGGPGSARGELGALARQQGVPFEVATAMRASVSPRTKLPSERRAAESVFAHPLQGPGADAPIQGVGIQKQAQKALAIRKAYVRRGEHPSDVEVPRRSRAGGVLRDERKTNPAYGQTLMQSALSGPKVEAYYGAYTRPDDPRTKTAVDTHMIGGAAPHLSVAEQEHMMRNVPGASELIDYHTRQEAKKRGLAGPEAQSVAWHVRRGADRGIQDEPKANRNVSHRQLASGL